MEALELLHDVTFRCSRTYDPYGFPRNPVQASDPGVVPLPRLDAGFHPVFLLLDLPYAANIKVIACSATSSFEAFG
jgi:hypothetical protein